MQFHTCTVEEKSEAIFIYGFIEYQQQVHWSIMCD